LGWQLSPTSWPAQLSGSRRRRIADGDRPRGSFAPGQRYGIPDPATEVDLSFDTSGELAEILVDVGDEVEAGQVLARIDPASAEMALEEAEATCAS
jgi:hypothetical protein